MTVVGLFRPPLAVRPSRPLTHPPENGASPRFHIPSLDGIRALAIFIVFLSHSGLGKWVPGIFGVTVFFFLSGYLITTLLRLELENQGHIHFGQFYLRRTLRIFPPLYAYILLLLVLASAGWIPQPKSAAVLSQAFYSTNFYLILHGSGGMPVGSVVLWSLAIEEHFYLLFPFLFVLLRKAFPQGRTQACLLLAVCGIIALWRCWLMHVTATSPFRSLRIDYGTDTRFDSMLFGCALALWGNPAIEKPLWSESTLKRLMVPLAALVLILTLACRSVFFRDSFRFTLQGLALIPLFTAAIQFPKWSVFPFLNTRPIRFIGVLSYTIYLVHLTILTLMAHLIRNQIIVTIISAAIAIAIATISYHWLEQPCARLRKRFSSINKSRTNPVLAPIMQIPAAAVQF